MATSFPAAIDAFTNPTASDTFDSSPAVYHDVQHANANDAIEAIQTKLGISASVAAPDSRLEGTDSGTSAWRRQSAARAYGAAQPIADGAWTTLTLSGERFDNEGAPDSADIHHSTTNTSRLTCRTAGKYLIWGAVQFASGSSAGLRGVSIYLNGTSFIGINQIPAGVANALVVQVTTVYALGVGDYVELRALQTSGGSLQAEAGAPYAPEFAMVRIAS